MTCVFLQTLNYHESYSLRFKQDKVQFATKNYILLSVCWKLWGLLATINTGPCFQVADSHKFWNCRNVACMVVIEFKLQAGHWQLIPLGILIWTQLCALIEINRNGIVSYWDCRICWEVWIPCAEKVWHGWQVTWKKEMLSL